MDEDFPVTAGHIELRRDLVGEGWTDRDIARAVRDGGLEKVRYGAYIGSHLVAGMDDVARARVRSRAVLRTAHPSSVLTHCSALAEYGVPLWGVDLELTHLTRTDGGGGRRESGVVHHHARLADDEWVVRDGVAVTTPARAAIEVVTSHGAEVGLVTVSGILHSGLATPAALRTAADRAERWPNSLNARMVLARADRRLSSVLESRTWHFFHDQRLPRPEPQVWVYDEDGNLLGIVDFVWRGPGVFLEVDGRAKYDQHRRAGETLEAYLMREKRREERICAATGWVCVRITWGDLQSPSMLARRIRRLLDGRGNPAA